MRRRSSSARGASLTTSSSASPRWSELPGIGSCAQCVGSPDATVAADWDRAAALSARPTRTPLRAEPPRSSLASSSELARRRPTARQRRRSRSRSRRTPNPRSHGPPEGGPARHRDSACRCAGRTSTCRSCGTTANSCFGSPGATSRCATSRRGLASPGRSSCRHHGVHLRDRVREVRELPVRGRPLSTARSCSASSDAYFTSSLAGSTMSLVANLSLVTKVYFPRVLLPLASALVPLVDLMFGSVVLVPIMWYPDLAGRAGSARPLPRSLRSRSSLRSASACFFRLSTCGTATFRTSFRR